ncbi:PI4KB_6 [Blepharisma stoltei]|uniref:1-phosphatidylinositol 4-kinase n=1 Tax=Blepharisma stoltei TaxID=1481888 RepID=A0AAU9JJZ4_9CILI|nr:unnamed protein product [Blepharisma stoltei]
MDKYCLVPPRRNYRRKTFWNTFSSHIFLCCTKNEENTKRERKQFWKIIRDRISKKKDTDRTYNILLDLYEQKNVISELEKCKISPSFTKFKRDDLEFYAPQLCNLLLYDFHENLEELVKTVLVLCKLSFQFSHKVYWFLNSTDFSVLEPPNVDPFYLIKSIETISSDSQSVFLGEGKKLLNLLAEQGLDAEKTNTQSFAEIVNEENDKQIQVREVIKMYNEIGKNAEVPIDVNPKYIPLNPFPNNDIIDGYHSTLWFYDRLTQISLKLLKFPKKGELLKEELKSLNLLLPAAVYIPFSNLNCRNSSILHIPISEAKVFTTKERAPFLICIEVFRPYEELQDMDLHNEPDLRRRIIRANTLPFKLENRHSEDFNDPTTVEPEGINELMKSFVQRNSDEGAFKLQNSFAGLSPALHYDGVFSNIDPRATTIGVIYGNIEDEEEEMETNENVEQHPSALKESFKEQANRIKAKSPFGKLKTWDLVRVIVKSGDDLRQEQLAMQLISFFWQTFKEKKLDIYLYAYEILATGLDCGIIECVQDAVSIDGLKKSLPADRNTLYDFFRIQFGDENSKRYKRAKKNFMRSLAGYSLLCYILQIKDRHNGNILIDRHGHLIHIDFGFLFSNSPGGNLNFEKAPFKLTDEFERILGGRRSKIFIEFRSLCVKGFIALRAKAEQIILLVEMMRTGSGASLPCFCRGEEAIKELRARLMPREKMSESDCKGYVNMLIDESLDNWTTRCYDRFQYCCQNIFY